MIVVKLIGGLGNQLFQYALGRNLALKNNTELKLDISGFETYKLHKYGLHHFNIIENFASEKDLMHIKMPSSPVKNFLIDINCKLTGNITQLYFKEAHFNFDPNFFKLTDNQYLDGYWQSEKYFKDIKSVIVNDFKIKTAPNSANKKMSESIENSNSISIHIRRGDYITDAKTNNDHGVCSWEYYENAIEKIVNLVENPLFFIFSDDPLWVEKNFEIAYDHIYVNINDADKNYEDLRLMTLCKHHIIANSTFSWWGAWLNLNPDKIIYAPKKWFDNLELNTNDLIPTEWMQI